MPRELRPLFKKSRLPRRRGNGLTLRHRGCRHCHPAVVVVDWEDASEIRILVVSQKSGH